MAQPAEVLALMEKANRALAETAKARELLEKQAVQDAMRTAEKARELMEHRRTRSRFTKPTPAVTRRPCNRARESRGAAPGRRQGSRRTGSATRAGPSDDSDPSGLRSAPTAGWETEGLKLWRHPDLGAVTPNLYRLLIGGR